MMEMMRVKNLDTGEERWYTCSPEQAVVAAYEQGRGNWNTWDYLAFDEHPKARRGRYTVSCGDFTAMDKIE